MDHLRARDVNGKMYTHSVARRSRRSRLDIYIDVLWAIKNGIKKPTQIMYEANLSWGPLQRVLKSMIFQGLVKEVDARYLRDRRSNRYYELTQKGENVARYFKYAANLLERNLGSILSLWDASYNGSNDLF